MAIPIIGVLLSAAACVFFGVSTILQKRSMKHMDRFHVRGLIGSRKWITAVLVGGIGLLCYLAAIALTSVTIVQPIVTASLVIPIIAGNVLFGEKIGGFKWLAVALILIGIAIVIL